MNRFQFTVSVLAIAMATGCGGHLGASYAPAVVPANRGVVYIYRPARHKGSALNLEILAADEGEIAHDHSTVVGYLENEGYIPLTAVGKTRITYPYAKKSVDLDVAAGKSYYVRIAIVGGLFETGGSIEIVDEAAAKSELADVKIQENTYRGK
jgi:hypothetical protein